MGSLITTLENVSARRFLLFGMLMCAAAFFGLMLAGNMENNAAACAETEYRIALAGRLINEGIPEEKAAQLVTAPIDEQSISAGEAVMAGYGYKVGSAVGGEYARSGHMFSVILSAVFAAVCVAVGTAALHSVFSALRRMTCQLENGGSLPETDEHDIVLLRDAIKALLDKTEHLVRQTGSEKQYLADYLSDFSHQIKTPCTGLILNNDILSSCEMPFEEQLEYFRRDRKCLERISLLTSESLKLARLDAGAVEYNIEPLDISEPAAEAVGQLTHIARENGSELLNEIESGTVLMLDRLWITEAITNLAKNALEHTHGGCVRLYSESDPMTAKIVIEDNGCGISEQDLPKVFRRFYSKSNAVTSGSVGIGMSIAKRIVEDMNGKVFIDSELGKGTKITLEFWTHNSGSLTCEIH